MKGRAKLHGKAAEADSAWTVALQLYMWLFVCGCLLLVVTSPLSSNWWVSRGLTGQGLNPHLEEPRTKVAASEETRGVAATSESAAALWSRAPLPRTTEVVEGSTEMHDDLKFKSSWAAQRCHGDL